MSFDLKVRIDTSDVKSSIDSGVVAPLGKASDAAASATSALGKMGDAGAASAQKAGTGLRSLQDTLDDLKRKSEAVGPLGFTGREMAVLERIKGPMREYGADVEALNRLNQAGAVSVREYETELVKLQKHYGATAGAEAQFAQTIEHERQIFERIRGPIREAEREFATLEAMHKRGAISAKDYSTQLDLAAKKAGIGPAHGPATAGQAGSENPWMGKLREGADSITSRLGPAGELLSGIATKGNIAAAAVIGLTLEFVHLGDQYIELANAAQKVTEKGHDVNETLAQQMALSRDLHAGLHETLELYDAVRDGTDELNMSSRQQLQLAKDIGNAVVAEGKSVGQAEALMKRLTFAFASGTISGRDLKSIMKEFPDIGAAFVEAMGHSRKELVDMANKGQISADMLIATFNKIGHEMEEKVGRKAETTTQMWQHFKDEVVLSLGKFAESTGIFELMSKSLEAVAGTLKLVGDVASVTAGGFKMLMMSMEGSLAALRQVGVGLKAVGDIVYETATSDETKRQTELAHAYLDRLEALKLLGGEEEKNRQTAELVAQANKLNLKTDFGDFNEKTANEMAAMRIELRKSGHEMTDPFSKAQAAATLLGHKLDEIKERKAADDIAMDVKKIWDAMHGGDEIVEKQLDHWQELAGRIDNARKAIEKWKALTPAGTPISQERRELQRGIQQDQIEQNLFQYGKGVVSIGQSKAQAADQLRDFNRALKAGEITAEAFRRKYDETMTTMNDGRLPEVIKMWEAFSDPIAQHARDIGALNALFRSGRFDAHQYNLELQKMAATDTSRTPRGVPIGPRKIGGIDLAIGGEDADRAQQARLSATTQLTRPAELDAVTDSMRLLNEQLEREFALMRKFEEPLVTYENALKDINATQASGLITQQQANVLMRQAREAYEQASDALGGMSEFLKELREPQKQYNRQLEEANEALSSGAINAEQYGRSVDKIRAAYLAAKPEAKSFGEAVEAAWLDLKREADNFDETLVNTLMADLDKFNEGLISMANGGKADFAAMVDSMVQDLERLILKQLEVAAINALISAYTSSSSAGSAATGGGAATGPITSTTQVSRLAPSAGAGVSAAAAPPVVVQVHNHYDKSVSIAAIDSPQGNRAVLNVLRANSGAARKYTSR